MYYNKILKINAPLVIAKYALFFENMNEKEFIKLVKGDKILYWINIQNRIAQIFMLIWGCYAVSRIYKLSAIKSTISVLSPILFIYLIAWIFSNL